MTIWINGAWTAREQATISVFDHGLLYGDGLFEGIRAYGGRIFRLKAHMDRLFDGMKAICLAPPLPRAEIEALLVEAAARETAQGNPDCYIRLLATRGEGPLGIDPTPCERPGLVVIADRIQLYPREFYDNGVPVVSSALRRNPSDSLDPRIKGLNYLNNVLARLEAKRQGAQEALLLNHQGYVAECTGDNVVTVKNGVLRLPAPHHGALAGITLQAVLELARRRGLPVREEGLTLYDVHTADEVFLTGTGAEIVGVRSVDGRPVGGAEPWRPGPVLAALREDFRRALADDDAWFAGA